MPRHPQPRYREERDDWIVYIQRHRITLAKGKANRKEALQAFHKLMAEQKRPRPSLTLRSLVETFLDTVAREREPLTHEWYSRHLTSFLAYAGDACPVAVVQPQHVAEWLGRNADWGRSTRDGAIRAVKRLFRWAKKQRLIETNELADVEKPGVQPRLKIITPEQARAIVAAIPDREFREYLTFLSATGCRPSEAMRVERLMIHFGERVAVFPGKTTWRTKRERVIYLPEVIIPMLLDLCQRQPEGALFRNTAGTPWTRHTIAHRFGRLRKRLNWGPEATASAFRHRHITDALLAGIPIATVAEIAGHTSTAMISRHYSKLHEHHDHILDAVNRVSVNNPDNRETAAPLNGAVVDHPTATSPAACEDAASPEPAVARRQARGSSLRRRVRQPR